MSLRVAIQMDPVESIKPASDSTLLLGLEAQRRGHMLYYYTPDKLAWRAGAITAAGHAIKFYPDPAHYYELGEALTLDLRTMDVVLLRQDPPFNMTYLSTTYILEMLSPKTLVVNNPASVRNHPEKLFPTLLRQFMPPTLVTADVKEIEHFRNDYKDVIIKPLYGHGGHSIFRFKPEDDNFNAMMEMIFSTSKEPWMVQPFLPEVKNGERRIILIDGAFGGMVGRIPAEHEIRANLRVGGKAVKAELTPRQREICEALASPLKDNGLIFAGLDVIGDYLIEVNITSPTTLAAINQLYGVRTESAIWDAIESHITPK